MSVCTSCYGVRARLVQPNSALAARNAQHPAVVHGIQQLRRCVARTNEPVGRLAMGEVRVGLARVDHAALAHEIQYRIRLAPTRLRSRLPRRARVHQRMQAARDEAVVDEEVFLDWELWIAAFEIAGAVVAGAVAEDQVLRACGGADGVGLEEAELGDGFGEGGWLEERAVDGVAAEVGEGWRGH
jgi:hypothetical protein